LKSILANPAICNAYVEYNIQDQMSKLSEKTPVISLYFKGHLSRPRRKINVQDESAKDRRIVRMYLANVIVMGFLTTYIWVQCLLYTQNSFTTLIIPWG
jgi:hypothetical protein